jgi:hypothetical protein
MRTLFIAAVLQSALASAVLAAPASAQEKPPAGPKPSQLGSVTQQVNDTVITLEYSRPVARGRALFGQLVPWGRVWTPGANDATTITVSTDIQVNGQKLPAGTYTVWSEPKPETFTVIFNRIHPVFHLRYLEVAHNDVLRVPSTPRQGGHMETLAWYFPVVDGRRAELVFHWGTTVVPLDITVP